MRKPLLRGERVAWASLVLTASFALAQPAGIKHQDVGFPALAGSYTAAAGKLTVKGGGNDIWGNADNFHYAYIAVTGDFDYVVKVEDLQGPDNWSKAELMAREGNDDGAGGLFLDGSDRHISNMTTRSGGQNEVALQWRSDAPGSGSAWPNDIGIGTPLQRPTYPNTWLRLERVGSKFWGYAGTNGTTWTLLRGSPYDFLALNGNEAAVRTAGNMANKLALGLAVTAHNDGDATGATGVFSEFKAYTPVPISIATQPPATLSVAANSPLSLSVAATGDPLHYQWRKDGTDIPGATSATFAKALSQPSDAGSYTVRLYGAGQTAVVSTAAAVTVTVDATPPTLVKASADETFTAVNVEYSEPVNATAENKANYALDPAVTVASVARLSPTRVQLTVGRLAEGTAYTLTVNNVQDAATPPNSIAANSKATFKSYVFVTGFVLHKFWENVSGNNIAALQADPRFPNAPTWVSIEPRWEYGPNGSNESGSNYGNELTGWFIPATSGNYVFFTCSDDPSNLYLSTDETPANKKLIAQETGWSNARNWIAVGSGDVTTKRSDQFPNTEWPAGNTITLAAGKRYYMESQHTEGGGGDNVGATFIKEGAADPANGTAPALTGALIGTYIDPSNVTLAITNQPQSVAQLENTAATFTVGVSSSLGVAFYQWQKAPAGGAFADLVGATAASYTTPVLALADHGSRYRAVVSIPGVVSTNSAEATVTVTSDTVPPTLVSAKRKFSDATKVSVVFSELLGAATANLAANYSINNGIAVSAATLAADGKTVVLTTSTIAKGSANTLTVTGVKDAAGNAIAAGSQIPIAFELGALFVVSSGTPPAVNASDALLKARLEARGYDIQVVGSDADDVSMATGKDLVVLSSTFASGNVTDTYKNVPIPVINWEQAIQDDLAWTTVGGSADRGTTAGLTAIEIVNATHQMAAGLPAGNVTVVTASSEFSWGQPNANAVVIARLIGTANACIYGYDKDALLTDGSPAAERRVHFLMSDNVAAVFNEAGWKLWDAAIDWAQRVAPVQAAPRITGVSLANGTVTIQWSNGGTLQSTPSLSAPVTWTDETGNGSFSAPATGAARFYRVKR